MRTWVFFIASKRAQDHQNRSPDVKVVPVSVSRLQQFGLAGSSGSSPISSGLCPDHLGSSPDDPGFSKKSSQTLILLAGSSGYPLGSSRNCPDHPAMPPDIRVSTSPHCILTFPDHPGIARIIRVCVQIIRAGQQLRETALFSLGV